MHTEQKQELDQKAKQVKIAGAGGGEGGKKRVRAVLLAANYAIFLENRRILGEKAAEKRRGWDTMDRQGHRLNYKGLIFINIQRGGWCSCVHASRIMETLATAIARETGLRLEPPTGGWWRGQGEKTSPAEKEENSVLNEPGLDK